MGRYAEKKQEKVVERNKTLLAAKRGRGSVSLGRRGRGAERKRYERVVQENRSAGYKL